MKTTRRFKRYPTQREARFFLKENAGGGQECTIITVSRKGMGIIFHTDEKINVGTTIRFDVPVATSLETISVRGMLKWLDQTEVDFIGGVELTQELSDVKFSKLC
jgi:hypothetical protein